MIPALLRHLVESTAFAAIIALFPFLMRKRGAAARHAVWFIAASKFALPLALFSTAGMELRSLIPSPRALFTESTVVSSILLPAGPTSMGGGTTVWIATLMLAVWLGGFVLMLALWLRGFLAPAGSCGPVLDSEIETLHRLRQQVQSPLPHAA